MKATSILKYGMFTATCVSHVHDTRVSICTAINSITVILLNCCTVVLSVWIASVPFWKGITQYRRWEYKSLQISNVGFSHREQAEISDLHGFRSQS